MRPEETPVLNSPFPSLQYGSGIGDAPSATHDTSRVSYHVKHLDSFAQTLQESASRAFPNKGRSSQRYKNVQVLLLHWKTDDLFVLPELEDLATCFSGDYGFNTDIFAIPSDNPHLDLMLKVGALIKEHESDDTLFVVYYGGHAKIDESRQSTWCATRHSGSPSLQWSAIQTLLERSVSDVLILLDCCAGAASATFPNGKSITETISASSWDAIAPDPGRYSFTNALIEVLGEWRLKTFSAAMLHAEVLARLKHPRPIRINGKRFEARSTPVHFMMTSDHKAPSIEMSRIGSDNPQPPSPPQPSSSLDARLLGRNPVEDGCFTEPNEDKPHVMISLALEDDQRLDLNAWEQWLASFPALAKYVSVQGVFKSHSTLLLLSMPVTIWDLLPEDQACSFVAFIRSNNLVKAPQEPEAPVENLADLYSSDRASVFSGTTFRDSIVAPAMPMYSLSPTAQQNTPLTEVAGHHRGGNRSGNWRTQTKSSSPKPSRSLASFRTAPLSAVMGLGEAALEGGIIRKPLLNQSRNSKRTIFENDNDVPEGPALAAHVVNRLQDYYQKDPHPSDGTTEYYASHLGIEARDVKVWFHRRRQREKAGTSLEKFRTEDNRLDIQPPPPGPQTVLAGHLNDLLGIFTPAQILFIDLRSPSEFQKSHIHGAINLRVPLKFLKTASLDMLGRTFTDEQSRRAFSRWSRTRCMLVYDRNIEGPWECPVALALLEKFRREGSWSGRCFLLKGPFREFCLSYDKYITGDRMTKAAKRYEDGLRSATPPTVDTLRQKHARYEEWLRRVEREEPAAGQDLTPAVADERAMVVDEHQRELEAEFKARFPDLYKNMANPPPSRAPPTPPRQDKEAAIHDNDYFNSMKGPLVDHLAMGLDKMRENANGGPQAGYSFPNERLPDKLGEISSLDYDDFDEIDPREASPSPYYVSGGGRSAAAADVGSMISHTSSQSSATGNKKNSRETQQQQQQQQRQGLWKRLRSNGGK
ncbi:hypothetical protein FJTKL_09910 [Diaporthe vaccinii]|uniref:Homeobox domain-containing protein n=1 Tax=Diaporthe vaccinii TaxID=105482 RepID=A0ABR4EMD7_9PEZI